MKLAELFSIGLISTGGTIEKTYDEQEGILANGLSVLETMLSSLQLDGVSIHQVELMNKDSQDMSQNDHDSIADCVNEQAKRHDGVIVIHGTDTLSMTGDRIVELYPNLGVTCILTGAMRPWIMRNTDALQNIVESFAVVQILPPGVYVAMQNRVLEFPGVTKDKENMRFVKTIEIA
jgi:L-asparaginase